MRTGSRSSTSRSARRTRSSPAAPIRGSRRISIRAATRSCSRSACRRISARKELIWTLTANGKTENAYASLKTDYQIDQQVISTEVGGDFGSLRDELRTNMPPELIGGGDEAEREGRRADHADRGREAIPTTFPPGAGSPSRAGRADADDFRRGPLSAALVDRRAERAGLRFSWIVYRGNASAVTFTPDQMKTWTDTRAYANSPWSPPWTIPLPPPRQQVAGRRRRSPSRAPTCCAAWRATDRSSRTRTSPSSSRSNDM